VAALLGSITRVVSVQIRSLLSIIACLCFQTLTLYLFVLCFTPLLGTAAYRRLQQFGIDAEEAYYADAGKSHDQSICNFTHIYLFVLFLGATH
jgi:hypothetical protein